jgi:hypothetical protein
MKQPDKDDNNCGRLWKMRTLFDKLSNTYTRFYNPHGHLAIDDVMLFKGRVTFKPCIPKKHICFGIKTYKLCNMTS